jgi:nitroimidazol reductase NimA-like FMN-containing flavoprotein (pyridoxamine 5'-phosphate oxidase superfamily)
MMRRDDFELTDSVEIQAILMKAEFGSLGVVTDDGYPRVVPVNFASSEMTIYFHGALEGEKFELLKDSPKVSFSVVEPYAILPSYWNGGKHGCPATQFFKSVQIDGTGSIVEDAKEVSLALNLLMKKYQPEGGYEPFAPDSTMYQKALKEVGIFKVIPDRVSAKWKFGQNESEKVRRTIVTKLRERGNPVDLATADIIARTLSEKK